MATKYVSTTGSDSTGTGAIGAPWATISKGLAAAATGDTLQIRGGSYTQSYVKGHDTLIVENYAAEAVVVYRTTAGTVMGFENCRNITVRKNASGGTFTVTSTVAGNGSSSGILFYESGGGTPGYVPSGITIDGIIATNIAGWGIQVKNASAVVIQNCDVSHCGTGIRPYVVTGASYVQDNTCHHMDRMIVSDATSPTNDNGGTGIALDLCTALTCRRNLIYECHAVSIDYGVDGGAIELYQSDQCVIEWNTAYNNEGFIETGSGDAVTYPMDANTVRRNTVYGRASYRGTAPGETAVMYIRAGTNYHIYNNTFDMDDGNAIFFIQGAVGGYDAPITNLKIKNNVCVSRHASMEVLKIFNVGSTSGIEIDYNLFWNSTGSSAKIADDGSTLYVGTQLATWQAAKTYSDHDVWNSDPLWTDRTVRDYSLQSGSPAKDAGVAITGITTGYLGAAPDIGALEYSVLPPPGGTPATAPVITFPAANGYNTSGTVTISGTCLATSSIELFDGATSKGTTPAPSTTWSFTFGGVTAGAHSYTAKATDSASAVSAASNTRTITVDLTAPGTTFDPVDLTTGVALSKHPSVKFSKAMDPLTLSTASCVLKVGGVAVAGSLAVTTVTNANDTATFTPTVALAAGTEYVYDVLDTAKDLAGHSPV